MGSWLLTGGAGYIGSHVARELLNEGHDVVVLDDLSTGSLERVPAQATFVQADVHDTERVRQAMRDHHPEGVIHLAASKSVEQSVADPLMYYRQNCSGLLSLLTAMAEESVTQLVFSSSAAVYGTQDNPVVDETAPTQPDSPYGRTKLVGEWMVRDAAAALGLSTVSLRYFNVVGCSEPALADVAGANLFPAVLSRIAAGRPVSVFGADYPTIDGTCVRDYIHVQDLARAHVAAARLSADSRTGASAAGVSHAINIGTGSGHSVLEVLDGFADALGQDVARTMEPRRAGDPAAMVAQPALAHSLLGWKAELGLTEMVASSVAGARLAGLLATDTSADSISSESTSIAVPSAGA